jgi:hypothetical protein
MKICFRTTEYSRLTKRNSAKLLFDFELPEGMGGDYTLYAVYVQEDENPVTNGLSIRSNLAIRQIVLANRNDL